MRLTRTLERKVTRTLSAALLIVVLLTGCSAESSKETGSQKLRFSRNTISSIDTTALAARSEERIALCMKEAGFEYSQHTPAVTAHSGERDSRYIQQHGLGVSTRLFSIEVLPQGVEGSQTGGVGSPQVFVTNETKSERAEYLERLAVCDERAYESLRAEEPEVELLEQLEDALPQAQAEAAAAEQAVFRCMKEAGYQQSSMNNIYTSLNERGSELIQQYQNESSRQGQPLSDELIIELTELQTFERKIAEALWECGWFPENPTDETRELWREYEDRINVLIGD